MRKKIILFVSAVIAVLVIVFGFQIFNKTTATYDSGAFNQEYDVIVVGGGTGGVSAALQAGRMGVRVALIEPTDWLGGQMTAAAVGSLDEGYLLGQDYGIFKEFMERVKTYYGDKPINTCYWGRGSRCIEPHVGNQILKDMVAENKNIDLYFRTNVYKVITYNKKIVGVETASKVPEHNLLRFKAPVLIDATEYGDMLPLAGASYRVGNETNETAQTGSGSCIQSITYSAVVRKYFDGVPPELVMDADSPPGGKESYSQAAEVFRRSVVKDGNGWLIDGKSVFPYNYRFPYNWQFAAGYRGLPDSDPAASNYAVDFAQPWFVNSISKTVVNMANDVNAGVSYIEDKNIRKKIDCQAKLKTLQYIYYIQHELGASDWSVATDEHYDTPYNIEENTCPEITGKLKNIEKYLPLMPYVRESRRISGIQLEDSGDIALGVNKISEKSFPNALALGDYFPDLHGCRNKVNLEPEDSSDDLADTRRIVEIPMGVFISKEIDGLLAGEKNMSITRVVNGVTRLQPVTMYTGQAVGAIAAEAVIKKLSPKQLDPLDVQTELSKSDLRFTFAKLNDIDIQQYPYLQSILANRIMSPIDNAFRPDNIVTKADWAVIISKLIELTLASSKQYEVTINDIEINDPVFPYVAEMLNRKLVNWCDSSARRYCPEIAVTRSELAYTLYRLYRSKILPEKRQDTAISDANGNSPYSQTIAFVLQTGLMDYCDDAAQKFCPDGEVTRLQAAEILSRILRLQ